MISNIKKKSENSKFWDKIQNLTIGKKIAFSRIHGRAQKHNKVEAINLAMIPHVINPRHVSKSNEICKQT